MKNNPKKKIFLTGGGGFIGRNILENLGKKYNFVAPSANDLDLTNEKAVYDFLRKERVDIIIHSANVGGARGKKEPQDALFLNLRMFFNLVKAKPFYKKLIMLGSGAEYDKKRPIIKVKEDDYSASIPIDQYGFYKYVCAKYAKKENFITHLRLFGVYGKYEQYETRFISNAICRVLFDLPITINKNVFFDYIYVDDLVKTIDCFLKKSSKSVIYNIGTGKKIDLLTIARKILKISGKDLPILVKNKGLNNEYTCDVSRLSSEFPEVQYTNFDLSIMELLKYYETIISKIKKESLVKDSGNK